MSRRARKYHPKPVHSNAVQIALARVKPLTAAFVAAHSPAAGGADEVSDEASAPRAETVIDPDWKFPSGHI